MNHTHEILHAFAFHIWTIVTYTILHIFIEVYSFLFESVALLTATTHTVANFLQRMYYNIDTSSLHIPTTNPQTTEENVLFVSVSNICLAYRWHRYASERRYMTNVSVFVIHVNVYKDEEDFLGGNHMHTYSKFYCPILVYSRYYQLSLKNYIRNPYT